VKGLDPDEEHVLDQCLRPGLVPIIWEMDIAILDRLVERGLVRVERGDIDGRPARFWHVTRLGELALRASRAVVPTAG
jgi:hypothetical protein